MALELFRVEVKVYNNRFALFETNHYSAFEQDIDCFPVEHVSRQNEETIAF